MISITKENMIKDMNLDFYGTGTVGEKGQIVIPSEARERLDINAGDKFVFCGHGKIIHMIKSSQLNSFLEKITAKFDHQISKLREVKENIKKSEVK